MAYEKNYKRLYWVNDSVPALSAENLNRMDSAIDILDNQSVELSGLMDAANTAISDLTSRISNLESSNAELSELVNSEAF